MQIIYEPSGRAKEYSLLAANLYAGCSHGCVYCYVPNTLHCDRKDFHENPRVRKNVIEKIESDAAILAAEKTNKRVLLCFATDPYQPLGISSKITRRVLEIFRDYDVPFQILTKAGTPAIDDFDLYSTKDAFAVTLTTMDEDVSRTMEPNAATPYQRIQSLMKAKKLGIETWVSLEPVLDPEHSLRCVCESYQWVDLYKAGTMNHCKSEITNRQYIDYARELISFLTIHGKKYFIKEDLAKRIRGKVEFTNCDNRTV